MNRPAQPAERGREGPLWIEGEDIDVSTFIKRTDDLLYRAKREGRNRVLG